ncbi:Imm51 family immunity protein [Cohnella sp. GCM10020058]|uniref:Imm51 family immunity protein n=1 Tax=Cohnella sp. GCM10020058 TaxID=3317330 RepID=UPI00363E7A48
MAKNLIEQLNDWHRKSSYGEIVDKIEQIPPEERDYTLTSHLARAYNNLNRYEEALTLLLSVAEQGAADALWHFRTGYSYYYLDRYPEAIAAFEQARRLDPADELTKTLLRLSRSEAERLAAKPASARNHPEVPFEQLDFSEFWEDSEYARDSYVSDPPTDELIAEVEEELGYKLPTGYIHMMKLQNGGIPRNTCFPTKGPTSWADDHIAITGIMGIGRDKSYSLSGEFGSPFMISEWGYPDIGVVLCDCPSAGHDVVMLDYRDCGPQGEPQVIHVDQEQDYRITFLASSFEDFVRGLVNEDVYDTSAEDAEQDLLRVTDGQFTPLLAELCGKVTEFEAIEELIRAVGRKIVEEKGYFSLHADRLSNLMYDVQFWLYTRTYPQTDREAYLKRYPDMLVFGEGFSTNGYAPDFVSDWLEDRIRQGMIEPDNGGLRFTDEAAAQVIAQLKSEAAAAGRRGEEKRELDEELAPFKLVGHGDSASVILSAGIYKQELFRMREDEGFEGSGYDWGSLAAVFLEERMPELSGVVRFDPEAGMFSAYSGDREAVVRFARAFKAACEDDALIRDLFSRAELD